jgi:CubicO group peptidase (beta-lactamase class C family)
MPDADTAARYADALQRLAVPYTVDARTNRATRAEYTATTLTASSGLISTARDLAQFDLALKQDLLLQPETLALAWRASVDRLGMPLPHGLGWFVQTYKGQPVAWQFGMSAGASSSLIVTLPSLRITLIALANSDGLTKPFALASGDVTKTPFGRLFLELFVR